MLNTCEWQSSWVRYRVSEKIQIPYGFLGRAARVKLKATGNKGTYSNCLYDDGMCVMIYLMILENAKNRTKREL